MNRFHSSFCPLTASLWLAVCAFNGHAEETTLPKVSEQQPAASKTTTQAAWPQFTSAAESRIKNLSPTAQKKLQKAINDSTAQVQKALEEVVREDEAAQLSTGGVPPSVFRYLESSEARPARAERRGPPPEVVARYHKLSDEAKDKLRQHFAESRERIGKMSPEERKSFMEQLFNKIAAEDEAKRAAPAASASGAETVKKPASAPTDPKRD